MYSINKTDPMLNFCPQGKGNPNKSLLVCGENPHGSKAVHWKLHRAYIKGHIYDKVFRNTLFIDIIALPQYPKLAA